MTFAETMGRLERALGATFDPRANQCLICEIRQPPPSHHMLPFVTIRVTLDILPDVVCPDITIDIQAQTGLGVSQLAHRAGLLQLALAKALEAEQIIQERSWPREEVEDYYEEHRV